MKKGFTLIELIVAISIIAVVATTVYVNIRGNQAVARDARRKADLKTLQTALELYYTKNASYPSTGGNWVGEPPVFGGRCYIDGCSPGPYIVGLAPTFLQALPSDPTRRASSNAGGCTNSHAGYLYKSDGNNYKAMAHCTPENPVLSSDSFYDSTYPYPVYAIFSSGGRSF